MVKERREEEQKEERSLTRMYPQQSRPAKNEYFRLLEVELRAIYSMANVSAKEYGDQM